MAQPAVRHGTPRGQVRRAERIVEQFGKLMAGHLKKMISNGLIDLDKDLDPTVETLLRLRTKLVQAVKKGMLERKDQEEVIGLYAAMIWWNRLEEQQRFDVDQSDLRG